MRPDEAANPPDTCANPQQNHKNVKTKGKIPVETQGGMEETLRKPRA